jgi:glucose dehydrogenase
MTNSHRLPPPSSAEYLCCPLNANWYYIIFYSDPNGTFIAASEREGKTLWHFDTNVLMKASPMTYMVDGKQFIAVAAGPNILCFGLP